MNLPGFIPASYLLGGTQVLETRVGNYFLGKEREWICAYLSNWIENDIWTLIKLEKGTKKKKKGVLDAFSFHSKYQQLH